MQETAPPPAPRETAESVHESVGAVPPLAPDRERDAGFRGEAFTRAALLFGLVFVAGFALVAAILWSRRKPARQELGGP